MESADILVLVAHPSMEQSRLNRRLAHAARAAASRAAQGPGGPRIQVRDLYALYPDYLIDTRVEQQALETARLVVWQHPVHWYAMPPLMKLWLDTVFAFGWAYGPGGTRLQGKDLWLVATTGGPEESYRPDSYNRYFFDAFLPPYEQTAALCGMRFLAPMVVHGAHRLSDDELEQEAALYAERLGSYPAWPELDDMDACVACEVPASARPTDDLASPAPEGPMSAAKAGASTVRRAA